MSLPKHRRRTIGNKKLNPATQMMSFGYDPFLSEGSVKPPVFSTSTFAFKSAEEGEEFFHIAAGRKSAPAGGAGLVYSRFNHPNVEIVEDRLALLDDAEAGVVCASGMGAISAVLLAFLRPGDVVLHSNPLYGGTDTLIRKWMPEFGIKTVCFSDGLSEQSIKASFDEAKALGPIKLVFMETPANPTNALIDLDAISSTISAYEKETGTRPVSVCDNTLMGPIFQRPQDHGIDINLYSITKYIGGHSDLIAGGMTGSKEHMTAVRAVRNTFGFNLDPYTSWMIARSLETLVIRMERSAQSGRKVADWLATNPHMDVEMFHPDHSDDPVYKDVYKRQCTGPGSTFAFTIKGGTRKDAFRLLNALQIFKLAVSLGGSESLISHPASTTHSGVPEDVRKISHVTEGLIRLSVGLEDPDDLIADLDQAMAIAKKG